MNRHEFILPSVCKLAAFDLRVAMAQGFGQWVLTGTNLTAFAPDGETPVRCFTLDDPLNPTQRV